jgi:uncharacterized protein (DUF58 family)
MPNRRNAIYLLLIACLLGGLFTGRAFFFNLAYLFGGLLLVGFIWAWLSVRWVTISRRTRARRAQVGRKLDEAFVVRNQSWLPKLWLEVRDHSTLPGHNTSHIVPAMRGRTSHRWYIETMCLVRGEFRLGPLTLMSGDPFGLFLFPRRLEPTTRVTVYPAIVPVSHFVLPGALLYGGEAQRRRAQYSTANASGVREYVPGDSFNRIHWNSTARRDRLMVKEFEIDPITDIWLFLDLSPDSLVEEYTVQRTGPGGTIIPTRPGIPASTEEYGVVIAASLTQYFIEMERALGFVTYTSARQVFQPERGTRQMTHILQTLATVRSVSPYTLAQALALETPYLTRGTTLIIITASLDQPWITQAQLLKGRHVQVMCVLIDPQSFGGMMSPVPIQSLLRLAKIPLITVRKNDDLTMALAQRPL